MTKIHRHRNSIFACFLAVVTPFMVCVMQRPAFAGESAHEQAPLQLPKIVVEGSTSYNFGTVQQATPVLHSFGIANQGNAPLKIEHIHSSCGCTAAVVESDTIQPQSRTELRVSFDTTGFQGPKVKTVRIYTNDPKQSSILFSLQGTVTADVVLSQPKLLFGEIRKGDTPSMSFLVSAAPGSGVELKEASTRSEYITITEEKLSGTDEKKKVTVSLKEEVPIGAFRDRISVKTTSKSNPVVNIPIFAMVKGDVEITPPVVSFGLMDGPLSASVSQLIKLKSRPDHIVRVKNISSDLSGVVADVVGMSDDGETTIKVLVRADVVGVFRANLTLETDSALETEQKLSVPVYGIVSKKSQ